MRRALLCAVAGAALAWLTASSAQAAEIVWPSNLWATSNDPPVLYELKRLFEEENPGITVKDIAVPTNVFWDKQFIEVQSGNPSDVVTMFDPEMRQYIEAEWLEPLDEHLAAAGIDTSTFVKTASLAQKDGKFYGIPYAFNPRALLYNQKMLADAGLEPPTNLEEFIAAVKALRDPAKQQFGFVNVSKPMAANLLYYEIMPVIMGFGGGFFKDGKPTATAPETVAGLSLVKELYDQGLIPRGVDLANVRKLFGQGKIAMYAAGGFMGYVVQKESEETYANLRSIPVPFPGNQAMATTLFLGVPKAAKNKELAIALLMRLLQDDMQGNFPLLSKNHPGRTGMIPANFSQENPWFKAFEEIAPNAKSFAPEGAEQYGAEIMKLVADGIERMLFGGVAAEAAAADIQKSLEDFMATKN